MNGKKNQSLYRIYQTHYEDKNICINNDEKKGKAGPYFASGSKPLSIEYIIGDELYCNLGTYIKVETNCHIIKRFDFSGYLIIYE